MKIKKFNQLFEAFNGSHFPITDNDIEDICTEMTDIGFKLTIKKRYINRGKSGKSITEEPLTTESYPLYEIELYKPEDESKPDEYWNGGLYYQDREVLNLFDSVVGRFQRMFKDSKVLWHIRNDEFNIRIVLNEIETEIGFDRFDFEQRVNQWSESFEWPIVCAENFGNSHSKTIQFKWYYSEEELMEILNTTKEIKLNNKSNFDEVLRSFDSTFGKEASQDGKGRPVKWSYNFEELKSVNYQPSKKGGIFSKKPEKVHFTWYDLEIKYEVVDK